MLQLKTPSKDNANLKIRSPSYTGQEELLEYRVESVTSENNISCSNEPKFISVLMVYVIQLCL